MLWGCDAADEPVLATEATPSIAFLDKSCKTVIAEQSAMTVFSVAFSPQCTIMIGLNFYE